VIADLGNCWMERDYEATVRRAGARVAVVQFADAVWGTVQQPSPGGRAVPGDGDLDIAAFFRAALDARYDGPFELEMVGPLVEAEGHEAALRRAVPRADALLEEVHA
jgi:sugar phosphate isomerase/epimerase